MVTTKKDAEEFAQQIAQLEDSGVDSLEYWKKKCQELENEMVLIKGITITNSPELREANKKIKEIEEGLANALEVNESHQKLNGKLQERLTELEQENIELRTDNKKLAHQVDDNINKLRRAGVL
jgi:uncharacterized coiled-coil DUF342 family protein